MGTLLDLSLMLGSIVTRKVDGRLYDWILAVSQAVDPTVVVFTAAGGGVDDSARLNALLTAGAKQVLFNSSGGAFTWKTPLTVPTGTHLTIPLGVVINSTIPANDGIHNAVFVSDPLAGAAATTTLAAPANIGDKTITLTSATGINVGDFLMLTSTDYDHSFQVMAIAGAVITTDIPIWKSFAGAASVYKYAPARNVLIEGNGTITTTGANDGIIAFRGSWDCVFSGLQLTGSNSPSIVRFGRGGRRNIADKIVMVGDGSSLAYGYHLTSEWGSKVCNFVNRWTQNAGVATKSCGSCIVQNGTIAMSSLSTSAGLLVSGNDTVGDTLGCVACYYEDIAIRGARSGIRFYDGSTANVFRSIDIRDSDKNGSNLGIVGDPGISTQSPVGNFFYGISIYRCDTGFVVNDNCQSNRVDGLYTEDCALWDIRISGNNSELTVDGHRFLSTNKQNLNAVVTIDGTGTLRAKNVRGTISTTNRVSYFLSGTGGMLEVVDGDITRVGNNALAGVFDIFNNVAFTLRIRDWKSGVNFGGGFLNLGTSPNSTARLTGRMEFQGAITGGQVNRGTIALNGATPVTYAFTDIQTGETVQVRRQANGGTPANFIATNSAGVGVVLTGTAGDTSTIAVTIAG